MAEKKNSNSTGINVFKNMPQAKYKKPNMEKILIPMQNPTPKQKLISGPRVASISTYFEEKNKLETKIFKSSTGQQYPNKTSIVKPTPKLSNFNLTSEQGQYPLKRTSRGKKLTMVGGIKTNSPKMDVSRQKIMWDKKKSPQPKKKPSNLTQFQIYQNLVLNAHLPSTPSEAKEAQIQTSGQVDQEDTNIDTTTSTTIEMPTTVFLMAKNKMKKTPDSKSNPKPMQCGLAEEGHHQHAQEQGHGQGEHHEDGEHHGDRQEGQEQGVEDTQHIPALKPSTDRAKSPVKWNQGPTGWGVGCAAGQVEHQLEVAQQEDHPQGRAQDQEVVHHHPGVASIIMPTTPPSRRTIAPVGPPRTPTRRASPSMSPPRTLSPSSPRGCTPVRVVCTPLWKRKRLSAQMSSSQPRSKQKSQSKPDRISSRKVSMSASSPSLQPEDPRTKNASPGSFPPRTSCVTAPIAYRPINPEQSASTSPSRTVEAGNLANREPATQRME